MKTVRFASVVERCGRPRVHALWVTPEKDPEFARARKSNRVMTVATPAHGKADVGIVGFDPKKNRGGQFLIFPKTLQAFDGARVVGVKFDLVAQPESVSAGKSAGWTPPPKDRARTPLRAARGTAGSHSHHVAGESSAPPSRTSVSVHRPARAATGSAERRAPPDRKRTAAVKNKPTAPPANRSLIRDVRAALAELRAGKAVAAYQRLEKAIRR